MCERVLIAYCPRENVDSQGKAVHFCEQGHNESEQDSSGCSTPAFAPPVGKKRDEKGKQKDAANSQTPIPVCKGSVGQNRLPAVTEPTGRRPTSACRVNQCFSREGGQHVLMVRLLSACVLFCVTVRVSSPMVAVAEQVHEHHQDKEREYEPRLTDQET